MIPRTGVGATIGRSNTDGTCMDLQRIIWLASFPKSGNTWLRAFLARYFMPKDAEIDINTLYRFTTADVRRDFFERAAGRRLGDVTVEEWLALRPKALRLIAAAKPGHHFVKTHCQVARMRGQHLIPPELTAAAVYVVRNPFDLAASYARHLGSSMDGAISRMADRENLHGGESPVLQYIGRWDEHVEGWTKAPGLTRHVMRYEDMVVDPERAFRALLQFLRVPVDHGALRRAVRRTSFEALQRQERKAGFRERPGTMEQFFVRGRAGGWREELTSAQVARLRVEFLPALKTWYPELVAETEAFAGAAP